MFLAHTKFDSASLSTLEVIYLFLNNFLIYQTIVSKFAELNKLFIFLVHTIVLCTSSSYNL